VGVQAVLDAVGETGVFDDAVGAAVKKSGLMDTLIEWGRKVPGAKEMIQNVKDRTAAALHRLGMDLDKWNLTRDQETEAIKLVEAANDFTDEEAGQIAQQVASELTHSDVNATIESNKTIFLKSKNMKLEGMQHPETDVAFKKVQFILNGSSCEVVAAQFKNVGQVHLQQEAYLWRRGKQDRCSSLLLWETLSQMDQSQNTLTEEQMQQLAKGKKPTGYTWHHDVIPGTVQLVDTKIHQKTGHTGGYAIWGRGSKTGGHDDG